MSSDPELPPVVDGAAAVAVPSAAPSAAPVAVPVAVLVAAPRPEAGTAGATARPRKHPRVSTADAPGADPHPVPEAPRSSGTENDSRLKADKPPHWG